MEYLSLLGIFAAVAVFCLMSMKRYPIYIASSAATLVIAIFSAMHPYTTITGPFMTNMSGFINKYFILFLVSALFGKMMDVTGCTRIIALGLAKLVRLSKQSSIQKLLATLSITFFYFAMIYVGITAYVIAFTVVYISRDLFQELDMPMWFFPYGPAGGIQPAYVLAGSLGTTNVIACQGFEVPLTAGWVLSIICTVVYFAVLAVVILFDIKKVEKSAEGFMPSGGPLLEASATMQGPMADDKLPNLVNAVICFSTPIIAILGFKQSPVYALLIAIVVCLIFNFKRLPSVRSAVSDGFGTAIFPVINVACVNGFSGTLQISAGFAVVSTLLQVLPGVLPAMVLMTGLTVVVGTSSGFLSAFIDLFREWMLPLGISAGTCARLITIAGFPCMMPHNAGLVNALTLTRIDFRKGCWIYLKGNIIPGTITMAVAIILMFAGVFQ